MNEHQPLDLRSPWVVSIHDLVRRPGEMKEFYQEIPAPADLGTEMMGVLDESPIVVDLRLESVSEGVLATGTVSAQLVGQCSRCLTAVREERDFDLQELYYYPGRDAEEDALFVVDEHIDLDPPMRDAIVLELPFTPLCRPDCLGLCPECGFNLNDDPEHSHGEQTDPRWADLQGFQAEG